MRPESMAIIAGIEAKTGRAGHWSNAGTQCRLFCTHGSSKASLVVWEAPDRVGMRCYSRGCDPREIVESIGLRISDVFFTKFSPAQHIQHGKIQNKFEIEAALISELLVLYKHLDKRRLDRILARDKNYLAEHPEFLPFPESHWERELLAARRTLNGIRGYYDGL